MEFSLRGHLPPSRFFNGFEYFIDGLFFHIAAFVLIFFLVRDMTFAATLIKTSTIIEH